MATAAKPGRKASGTKEVVFLYEGKDKSGKLIRGEMRTTEETVVRATLRRQGITVTKIKRQKLGGGARSPTRTLPCSPVSLPP